MLLILQGVNYGKYSRKPLIDRWQPHPHLSLSPERVSHHASVNLINAVAQECVLRKPDIVDEKVDVKEVHS